MSRARDLFWDYHLHNLILKGVHVEGPSPYYDDLHNKCGLRFKRFDFLFAGHRYDTGQRQPQQTPYVLRAETLYFQEQPLDLPFQPLNAGEHWGSDQRWYFKQNPDLSPFYELRLNPVTVCANLRFKTGSKQEYRGCAFCQRCYTHMRAEETFTYAAPAAIMAEIKDQHGADILSKVSKVMLMTGDTHTEAQMIDLAETIYYDQLRPSGFRGTFSIVTTMIQTEENIRRLAQMDSTLFEFPLECLTRRVELLGPRKGIPLNEVADIFTIARRSFKNIRTNYMIGLDDLPRAMEGFGYLMDRHLVDDVIANIFTPFTEPMLALRHPEANSVTYLYAFRELFRKLGLTPKRTGVTKNLFSHFMLPVMHDQLLQPVAVAYRGPHLSCGAAVAGSSRYA